MSDGIGSKTACITAVLSFNMDLKIRIFSFYRVMTEFQKKHKKPPRCICIRAARSGFLGNLLSCSLLSLSPVVVFKGPFQLERQCSRAELIAPVLDKSFFPAFQRDFFIFFHGIFFSLCAGQISHILIISASFRIASHEVPFSGSAPS